MINIPYPTRKTKLCAHQPVPSSQKEKNAERGAEKSFLTGGDKLIVESLGSVCACGITICEMLILGAMQLSPEIFQGYL